MFQRGEYTFSVAGCPPLLVWCGTQGAVKSTAQHVAERTNSLCVNTCLTPQRCQPVDASTVRSYVRQSLDGKVR